MTTTLATRPAGKPARKGASLQQKSKGTVAQKLPEYLYQQEVEALIKQAPNSQSRLLMLTLYRAGLRVSEGLDLEVADLGLAGDPPTLRIKKGKGSKARMVPMHPELAAAFRNYLDYSNVKNGRIFTACRSTAWRWVQEATKKAIELNQISKGKVVGTHTLRHSAARHWLASGVPLNAVSLWLGHSDIGTTLIYLRILPDPQGFMDRVP